MVCPGLVAANFHTVQGLDLSFVPRMSAEDLVTGTLAGIRLGESVIAPCLEDRAWLGDVFAVALAAFADRSPQLATRYRAT